MVSLDAKNNIYTRTVDLELQISNGNGDFAYARVLQKQKVQKDIKNWKIQGQLPDDLSSGRNYGLRLGPLMTRTVFMKNLFVEGAA